MKNSYNQDVIIFLNQTMKYFIQITLFFFILFTTYTYSYAELTNNKLQSVYNNFITKVEKKYSAQKQLVFVKKLSQNISNILDTRELSTAKKELLGDLLIINNEQIFEYEMSNEIMNQDQIILESKKRNDLFQNLQNIIIPSYITFQFDPEKVFQVNKDLEFIQNASLQRFDLQNYMEIT